MFKDGSIGLKHKKTGHGRMCGPAAWQLNMHGPGQHVLLSEPGLSCFNLLKLTQKWCTTRLCEAFGSSISKMIMISGLWSAQPQSCGP